MSRPVLGFVGAGNMATAIIGGLVAEGYPAEAILIADPSVERCQQLQADWGIQSCADNSVLVETADVVVLAVKPQVMSEVCEEIRAAVISKAPLVVSIAAGVMAASLERWLGADTAIVRCMPNTPSLVKTGASGLYANPQVSAEQRQLAETLMQAVGLALWVDEEAQLDAVTAVSGSGPAYYFLVMEAMIAAGQSLGLDAETSRRLTLQTALGAARMASESDVAPDELRRRVTSPKGTTERALKTFEAGDLRGLFAKALADCKARSEELARELDR